MKDRVGSNQSVEIMLRSACVKELGGVCGDLAAHAAPDEVGEFASYREMSCSGVVRSTIQVEWRFQNCNCVRIAQFRGTLLGFSLS